MGFILKFIGNWKSVAVLSSLLFVGYQWIDRKAQDVRYGRLQNQLEEKALAINARDRTIAELQKVAVSLKVKENQIKLLEESMEKMHQEVKWARDRVSKREKLVSKLRTENAELSVILDSLIPADLVR